MNHRAAIASENNYQGEETFFRVSKRGVGGDLFRDGDWRFTLNCNHVPRKLLKKVESSKKNQGT